MKFKLKRLIFLALTTCTLLVFGTGIVRAISIPTASRIGLSSISVMAQNSPDSGELSEDESSDIAAVNEATIAALTESREDDSRGEIPQAPVIRRTVIEDDYALATWTWGEAGGQTALSQAEGTWAVLTSGGGSINEAVLEEAGIPRAIAERLMEKDRASWQEAS